MAQKIFLSLILLKLDLYEAISPPMNLGLMLIVLTLCIDSFIGRKMHRVPNLWCHSSIFLHSVSTFKFCILHKSYTEMEVLLKFQIFQSKHDLLVLCNA